MTTSADDVVIHRGLNGVYFDRTRTSFIDGKAGTLLYRGYNIHDLAEHSTFEETAYLLLYGDLPTSEELRRFEQELKAARLARDEDRRDALSLVLNALQQAQKELQRTLSDDEELQVLQRERKRRVEAIDAFRAAGRDEQAEKEEDELDVLEEFMPEPLSEDEIGRAHV